ncbi:GntR family transcriptional regulator [Sinisalibacter aestuarii]|uniref:GntR family transcriptional regulator n=1 Tax=Sinisalibacter aestuarii TaxID=2949426 RepID=A0ABQ5LU08_9RHOB|nr:GntR family transcriptional regulator [Sinisalibacter aestuarii]GKY88448.1 GntR family transcriptional regulator [Sinisalibacter aestuarii]
MDDTGKDMRRSARDRFETLHRTLRDRICALDYKPGERLSEEALAEEFGISRTPLRRVLGRLEAEGLLRSVHGVGTIVTDLDAAEMGQVFRLRLALTDLFATLDPVAPDTDFVARFRRLRDKVRTLNDAPTPEGFTRLNRELFLAMLDLTANAPLRDIAEQLYFRTTRIWLQSLFASNIDLETETRIFTREVEDLLAALELGNVTAIAALRRAHLAMSFERLSRLLV